MLTVAAYKIFDVADITINHPPPHSQSSTNVLKHFKHALTFNNRIPAASHCHVVISQGK